MRDYKREAIPKAMVQRVLNEFGSKKVSELRNLKIVHDQKSNKKHYFIEVFVLDTTTHQKWNNPEAIFLFHFIDYKGEVTYISHKPRNTWDIGKIIPEDTNALLMMSVGLPGKAREEMSKTKSKKICKKPYCDIRSCETTASNAVMCKDSIIKTKELRKPIFEIPTKYRNVRNDWLSNKNPTERKYNCEINLPEFSPFRQPYEISPFSCKLRYDLDTNPHRSSIDESVRDITSPLKAFNYLHY